MDQQAAGGEDPNKPSKKKSSEDESKNKKLRDRITSFRKQGMKKEKPLIQHPTDPISTQTELPVPQPFFDERSMNLSEKEIVDLFEKMMEDMNLNEERKAPLRGKDLSTKREMVVQYISATAKSITGSKVANARIAYSTGCLSGRLCGVVVNYFIVLEASSSLGNHGASAGRGGS